MPDEHHTQSAYFVPYLSAMQLYSAAIPATSTTPASPATLLFSYAELLPPHTRFPLTLQFNLLVTHQPAFTPLMHVPFSHFDRELSWISLAWYPILIDLHLEQQLAGNFLAYYALDWVTELTGVTIKEHHQHALQPQYELSEDDAANATDDEQQNGDQTHLNHLGHQRPEQQQHAMDDEKEATGVNTTDVHLPQTAPSPSYSTSADTEWRW